jgi:hypothetical protein
LPVTDKEEVKMTRIELSFSDEMKRLVFEGKKTATTRIRKKGQIGDTFRVRNRLYEILDIEILPWNEVVSDNKALFELSMKEGFGAATNYIEKIESIYPCLKKDPTNFVAIHYFEYCRNIPLKVMKTVISGCKECSESCKDGSPFNDIIPESCPLEDYE